MKAPTLAETMQKFETVEADFCASCGNGWFFDQGASLRCTTCGARRELYSTEEEFPTQETLAWIVARTEVGLMRGIEAYKARFPVAGYGTHAGAIVFDEPTQNYKVKMRRQATCE